MGGGGEHGRDWSRSVWKRKASHNRNRMCAPQTSLTGGRTGMEGRALSCHGGRARPVNQEIILPHHFGLILGKLDSSLSTQRRGIHMPRNPELPDCSQTGPAFEALILNECCFAGQIPQACVGAWRGQDVRLQARQANRTIQVMRKQRENRAGETRGLFLSLFLGLGATVSMEPKHQRGRECQTQSKPFFIYQKELSFSVLFFFYASLFSCEFPHFQSSVPFIILIIFLTSMENIFQLFFTKECMGRQFLRLRLYENIFLVLWSLIDSLAGIHFLQNFEAIALLFSAIQCSYWKIQCHSDACSFVCSIVFLSESFKKLLIFSVTLVFWNFTIICLHVSLFAIYWAMLSI